MPLNLGPVFKEKLSIILKDGWYGVIAVAVFVIGLALTYRRLFFGVDFTDEAFYAAVPYNFLKGGQPFVDEVNVIMQFPSFFLEPFMHAYIALVGGTEGIMLFLRHLYLVFMCGIAAAVFFVLKNKFAWQIALLSALVPVVIVPHAIPALSYNTFGFSFFLLGIFLIYWIVSSSKRISLAIFPGIIHGLGVLAYPTLPVAIAVVAVILLVYNRRLFFFYLIGGSAVMFLALNFLIGVGMPALEASWSYTRTIGSQLGGIEKIVYALIAIWTNFSHKIWLLLLAAAIGVGFYKKNRILQSIILFIPVMVFVFGVGNLTIGLAMTYITYFALSSLPLFMFLIKDLWARQLFCFICLPSFAAGLVAAWSSSDGLAGAFLGLISAYIIALIFVVMIWQRYGNSASAMRYSALIPFISAIGLLVFFQYNLVYRDDPIGQLDKKTGLGPYKGIYTTHQKNLFMEEFNNGIKLVDGKDKKILIYDEFPGGYLFTSAASATNTAWLRSTFSAKNIDRVSTIKSLEKRILPDVIIRMKKIFITKDNIWNTAPSPGDPLDNFVFANYEVVSDKDNYTIYLKRND